MFCWPAVLAAAQQPGNRRDTPKCRSERTTQERLACNAATARGFEPLRAEPNGFLVHHLNHSVTLSVPLFAYKNKYKALQRRWRIRMRSGILLQ